MTHTATHSPACSPVAERGMWRAARCCRAAARAAARQHACLRAAQPHHVPCCACALPERGWGAQPSTSGRPAAAALHAAAVEAAPSTKKADITPKPIELPTSEESEDLLRIRHSCAHIMAMAVQRLRPRVQVTIGPWIERGFYYDFDTPEDERLTEADLKVIKKEMQRIIKADLPFTCEEVSPEEASARIAAVNEPYKQEILDGILARTPDAPITMYHIGGGEHAEHWWDLCGGPHVASTGKINPAAVELESLAGAAGAVLCAYWRGDEKRAMLQRVYGTAWKSKEQLKAYEQFKAEAARRDHRKLGAELELFSINEAAGPGLVFWHPKGAMVRHLIEDYWRTTHLARGYQLLFTPHVAKVDLWKTSGHYDFYRENMFDQMDIEDEQYQLRPMNCPFHIAIYKQGYYSYRDLPLRWCELGTVYRYERSGTMHGLFRVRGFTQDDAHIFCLPEQIAGEIVGVLALVEEVMGAFGFKEFEVNLSTRPEKSVGTDEIWSLAEGALKQALQQKGWEYQVDEGGGAFYGPKIDIKIKDAIGRRWQCSTIQLDFNLPARFDMMYVDANNERKQPIMIHRALLGSLERFFGILVENYAGAFPLWLAPVQARILPVTDAVAGYASEVAAQMRAAGIRVEVASGERMAKLIRNAEKAKVPVMCVVGAKEAESGTLAVRTYAAGDAGERPVADVIQRIRAAAADHVDF